MDILTVMITAFCSLVVLFLLAKLMGNKQIDQLSLFDYTIGITIGSIAAEMATELENPQYPLAALVVYGVTATAVSLITNKSPGFRRFVTGKPLPLLMGGQLDRKNFKKARLDLDDFLAKARAAGYFTLSDIDMALLEPNGHISFLPKSVARPLAPQDVAVFPPQEGMQENLVMDGVIQYAALKKAGLSEHALREQLRALGFPVCKSVFLASRDTDGTLTVYGADAVTPPV